MGEGIWVYSKENDCSFCSEFRGHDWSKVLLSEIFQAVRIEDGVGFMFEASEDHVAISEGDEPGGEDISLRENGSEFEFDVWGGGRVFDFNSTHFS